MDEKLSGEFSHKPDGLRRIENVVGAIEMVIGVPMVIAGIGSLALATFGDVHAHAVEVFVVLGCASLTVGASIFGAGVSLRKSHRLRYIVQLVPILLFALLSVTYVW